MSELEPYTIGIDATNLRAGGGVTHLIELLRLANPEMHDFKRIVVWAGANTLGRIEDRPWLAKRNPAESEKGLLQRTFWQSRRLSEAAREEGCDVLFVPGGSYAGDFRPIVTMSQNLLPFEMPELLRFGWTFLMVKLLLLRLTQGRSFRKADGVIFLTEYARTIVQGVTGKLKGQTCIVPHGLNPRFSNAPKNQQEITAYSDEQPYKVVYVSIIDQYKHQWHVVEAVSILRKKGIPIVLDLIGPAYNPALMRLNAKIDGIESGRDWVQYHGAVAFDALHHQYAQADVGLFASSCENMPNILLETMASGLPIACSNRGPMPEMLGQAGVYFNPEMPEEIADALHTLIQSVSMRKELAQRSFALSQNYTWLRCANETFEFINSVVREHDGND
jgi:glycosyltransferase involved in cell wall biosynthesis